jgi:membrane-bound lytic murein transglycosylase D
MQYKIILLLGLFVCIRPSSSVAQYVVRGQLPKVPKAPVALTAKQKEIIKANERAEAAVAREIFCKEEDIRSSKAIEWAASRSSRNKAMVPLAGQKSYFGPMNEYVIDFVKEYLGAHSKTLAVVNDRAKTKFSLMDNVLKKNNLPNQLKYLAVIESALNNTATSPVGAVGPWQFMESTARLMGLTVNGKRDDRTDWYKSTAAAAKYLNYLYEQMNDWLLVIAAYNSGPTPVQRAIELTGSRNFWDIKKYLPRETQGHVLAFIATASIFENLKKFIAFGKIPDDFIIHPEMAKGNTDTKKNKPPKVLFTDDELKNMAIISLKEPLSLDILAQELTIDKHILERWNPDYELFILDLYPEKEYGFRIPKDKIDGFIEKKAMLTKKSEKFFKETI